MMTRTQVPDIADRLDGLSAQEIIRWTVDNFGDRLAVGTSLGAEAIVMMDLVIKVAPTTPFIFLDTDLHFADTLQLLEAVKERFKPNLIVAKTEVSPALQAKQHGEGLYFRDPSICCEIRKIAPMRKALQSFDAWMTGMRKDQTEIRAYLRNAEWDGKFGLVKISPLLRWTNDEVWEYIRKHDLPYNRLHDMGYPSIGCAPCTRPVKPGEDPRAGRWAGFDKSECGLHTK
jgi:phosphoadenosine phosphosulfate reductase